MKKFIPVFMFALVFVPTLVFAQTTISNANDVARFIVNFINTILVPVVFAIAFIVFIWGIFEAFILEKDAEKQKKGRSKILWGIIGFFVMVSVWGIVNILTNTLQFSDPQGPAGGLPTAPVPVIRQ